MADQRSRLWSWIECLVSSCLQIPRAFACVKVMASARHGSHKEV